MRVLIAGLGQSQPHVQKQPRVIDPEARRLRNERRRAERAHYAACRRKKRKNEQAKYGRPDGYPTKASIITFMRG